MVTEPPTPPTTVANWQEPEHLRWAFQHVSEVIPTRTIAASPQLRPLARSGVTLGAERYDDVLSRTYTDGFLVLHDGAIVEERYFGRFTPHTRHLIMSVTKSVVSCVAGVLAERRLLSPEKLITDYVPELESSGYAGATVRDLLDMRTGVAFSETYTDPQAEVRLMERSSGWAPHGEGDPAGLYPFLATLRRESAHGGEFVYRSADTNVLGWVCERAAKSHMADLISEIVWSPIGAEFNADITVDTLGAAVHDGGMSAALRDLGRFGQMLLDEGTVDGSDVVPASWLLDSFTPPADVREAFAGTSNEPVLPGGWYRNQFWFFRKPDGSPVQLCLGIHGQLVYVDRATRTVIVKLSSWPEAQNVTLLIDTLHACYSITEQLKAR